MIGFEPYRGRRPPGFGELVEVYRNLNRRDGVWFSVRCAVSGRVLGHCRAITLERVRLVVGEAGRQRVLATGRKNVHAWVRGELALDDALSLGPWADLRYDPRRFSTFVDGSGRPVRRADAATLSSSGAAFASP